MGEYTIAPQHKKQIDAIGQCFVFQNVAYSPNKCTYLCYSEDSNSLEIRCNECDWIGVLSQLPKDGESRVLPDMCPACAKDDELGFLRAASPADGTFPSGWN